MTISERNEPTRDADIYTAVTEKLREWNQTQSTQLGGNDLEGPSRDSIFIPKGGLVLPQTYVWGNRFFLYTVPLLVGGWAGMTAQYGPWSVAIQVWVLTSLAMKFTDRRLLTATIFAGFVEQPFLFAKKQWFLSRHPDLGQRQRQALGVDLIRFVSVAVLVGSAVFDLYFATSSTTAPLGMLWNAVVRAWFAGALTHNGWNAWHIFRRNLGALLVADSSRIPAAGVISWNDAKGFHIDFRRYKKDLDFGNVLDIVTEALRKSWGDALAKETGLKKADIAVALAEIAIGLGTWSQPMETAEKIFRFVLDDLKQELAAPSEKTSAERIAAFVAPIKGMKNTILVGNALELRKKAAEPDPSAVADEISIVSVKTSGPAPTAAAPAATMISPATLTVPGKPWARLLPSQWGASAPHDQDGFHTAWVEFLKDDARALFGSSYEDPLKAAVNSAFNEPETFLKNDEPTQLIKLRKRLMVEYVRKHANTWYGGRPEYFAVRAEKIAQRWGGVEHYGYDMSDPEPLPGEDRWVAKTPSDVIEHIREILDDEMPVAVPGYAEFRLQLADLWNAGWDRQEKRTLQLILRGWRQNALQTEEKESMLARRRSFVEFREFMLTLNLVASLGKAMGVKTIFSILQRQSPDPFDYGRDENELQIKKWREDFFRSLLVAVFKEASAENVGAFRAAKMDEKSLAAAALPVLMTSWEMKSAPEFIQKIRTALEAKQAELENKPGSTTVAPAPIAKAADPQVAADVEADTGGHVGVLDRPEAPESSVAGRPHRFAPATPPTFPGDTAHHRFDPQSALRFGKAAEYDYALSADEHKDLAAQAQTAGLRYETFATTIKFIDAIATPREKETALRNFSALLSKLADTENYASWHMLDIYFDVNGMAGFLDSIAYHEENHFVAQYTSFPKLLTARAEELADALLVADWRNKFRYLDAIELVNRYVKFATLASQWNVSQDSFLDFFVGHPTAPESVFAREIPLLSDAFHLVAKYLFTQTRHEQDVSYVIDRRDGSAAGQQAYNDLVQQVIYFMDTPGALDSLWASPGRTLSAAAFGFICSSANGVGLWDLAGLFGIFLLMMAISPTDRKIVRNFIQQKIVVRVVLFLAWVHQTVRFLRAGDEGRRQLRAYRALAAAETASDAQRWAALAVADPIKARLWLAVAPVTSRKLGLLDRRLVAFAQAGGVSAPINNADVQTLLKLTSADPAYAPSLAGLLTALDDAAPRPEIIANAQPGLLRLRYADPQQSLANEISRTLDGLRPDARAILLVADTISDEEFNSARSHMEEDQLKLVRYSAADPDKYPLDLSLNGVRAIVGDPKWVPSFAQIRVSRRAPLNQAMLDQLALWESGQVSETRIPEDIREFDTLAGNINFSRPVTVRMLEEALDFQRRVLELVKQQA
jgi:hypothetical protein